MSRGGAPDRRTVFVVHGRNRAARDAIFEFLRAIGLKPLEWDQAVKLTRRGTPYIGEVLDHAFETAQAVVVLLTPDEVTRLRPEYSGGARDPDVSPAGQARPNVLFEAGMAFGRQPDRTILVALGETRPFSDIAGRHVITLDGGPAARKSLAERLETAECDVDLSGTDWLTAGDLTPPAPPDDVFTTDPLDSPGTDGGVDVEYVEHGRGHGRLHVTNRFPFAIHDLSIELPEPATRSFTVFAEPIGRLPPGKTAVFVTARSGGSGPSQFEIRVTGRTPDGDPLSEDAFVSLN